jgi:hypothetical protein
MTGAEFVDYLYQKYFPELEGPILAVRKALAELDTQSSAFVSLMQRQAKRELSHGIAFTKALLQYKELDHHEQTEVAEQAADEYKHYALIKDYLRSRGADVEDIPADAYDVYFGQFLTGDVEAFRLCNIAEKSAVVFMTHMSQASKDPAVRKLASAIVGDEEGHEERIKAKLAEVAEDESRRAFLEKHFVQSWASQKEGVFLEAKELGLDLDMILTRFKSDLTKYI